MRSVTISLVTAAIVWIAPVSGQTPQSADNVAAFARLYGVVRYFYPSDAASSLDWNRFAVHGVKRVREAKDPGQLAATLQELMRPLGPGIEIGRGLPPAPARGNADGRLVAWRYLGAGGRTLPISIPGPRGRMSSCSVAASCPGSFASRTRFTPWTAKRFQSRLEAASLG